MGVKSWRVRMVMTAMIRMYCEEKNEALGACISVRIFTEESYQDGSKMNVIRHDVDVHDDDAGLGRIGRGQYRVSSEQQGFILPCHDGFMLGSERTLDARLV
jgi:hypothetical protein